MSRPWPAPFGFTHLDWLEYRRRERARLSMERIIADIKYAQQAAMRVSGIPDILRARGGDVRIYERKPARLIATFFA